MQQLADLLAMIPLPDLERVEASTAVPTGGSASLLAGLTPCSKTLATDSFLTELGADMPAGHLHVWGGPSGAGKTAFLLCLLQRAAAQGRRVVYATYDLPPDSLAMRLLAMTAGVKWRALPDPGGSSDTCTLGTDALARAHAARSLLSSLPFTVLPARGFSARSLRDRVVRMPFRADVLAVDYLQGVIREPGSEVGVALRDLSALAAQLHVAVICAVRSEDGSAAETSDDLESLRESGVSLPDRVGWIAPLEAAGARQARIVHNPHGTTPDVPLHFDEATGSMGRAEAP